MTAALSHHLDELDPGVSFSTRGRTITESDIVSFATLSGDFHPIHTDAEWAAESEFGGRIAHGALLLSYCVGLLPFDPRHVLALRGFERIAFKRPVRIGDTIHVEGTVESKQELDSTRGLVLLSLRIVNQRGEAVAIARANVLWRRGSDGECEGERASESLRREVFL